MALITTYATGTATVNANETTVTGQGTTWLSSGIQAGDLFWAGGFSVRIASVVSNTSLTLAFVWPGASRSAAAYEVRFTPDANRAMGAARAILDALSNGVLYAFSSLVSATDRLPYFTGAGTAAVTKFTAFGRSLVGANDAAAARNILEIEASQTDLEDQTATGPETHALARPAVGKIFENISLFDVMLPSMSSAIGASEVTGTDATEITENLNNVLEDVGGLVRGKIFAPGGTYFFTGAGLFCPDKLRLVGEGPKVTLFRKAPGISDLDPILRERVSGGIFVPADDVQVENIGFIGNGDPSTPGPKGAGLLRLYAHTRLRLVNNHFSMSRGYGVGLQGALPSPNVDRRGPHIDTYIEGCYFWSNGKQAYLTGTDTDDGIDLKGSERLVVLNSRAWDNGDKGFDFRGKSVTAIGNFSYKNAGSGFSSGLEGVAAGVTSVDDGSHEYFGCHAWENGDANFVANGQTTPGVTSGRISVDWNECVAKKATNHNFSVPSKGTNDMLALSVALRGARSFDPVGGAHFNASAVLDAFAVEGGRFEGGASAGITVNTAQVRPVRINGASFKSIALNAINLSADASAHSVVANNIFDTIGGAAINGIDYVTTSGNDYTAVGNSQVVIVTGQNCKIKDNPVGTRTIASAATLTLPTLSDSFLISGSTTITAITSSYDGREVSLVFNAACTVTHSSALRLKSGANLSAVANTTLRLRYFNSCWREV